MIYTTSALSGIAGCFLFVCGASEIGKNSSEEKTDSLGTPIKSSLKSLWLSSFIEIQDYGGLVSLLERFLEISMSSLHGKEKRM